MIKIIYGHTIKTNQEVAMVQLLNTCNTTIGIQFNAHYPHIVFGQATHAFYPSAGEAETGRFPGGH